MADTTAGQPGRPAREPDRAVFIISVAAELAGVHPQTLRIYERKGLLHPKRTQKNSRRYSERDIERLRVIQELTAQGVNLAGVRRIMSLDRHIEKLQARLAELEQELADMRVRHRAELEAVKRAARRDIVPYSAAILPYRPPPR
ncbi:MAG TPA: helix-turn-helix transcriptional regulator [Actinomycetes bacterium]|nr:helix-turn-helix transcriptional regulator [Actinomycetes bacterium]